MQNITSALSCRNRSIVLSCTYEMRFAHRACSDRLFFAYASPFAVCLSVRLFVKSALENVMEMGIGFLVGLLGGVVVALVSAVIIAVSKRAMRKSRQNADTRHIEEETSVAHGHKDGDDTGRQTTVMPVPDSTSIRSRGNTLIVGQVESAEGQLNKNIQEVSELLLQLAAAISSTESTSGQASIAFNSARGIFGKFDSGESSELVEAKRVLIEEIDRVIQSNARLRSELDNANKGIEKQCQQIEELRKQARIDALTKIPNRAAFDKRMDEYISLLNRAKMGFSLLIMDIDHFKQVNDDHGHLNGDRILRGVAARISSSIRDNDFAARYGGEEFAVLLPATAIDEAVGVAERVRQDIAKTNFRLDDKNIRMTLSGGLVESRRGMTSEDVIGAADEALYQAKKVGRNRIVVNKGE